jgi:hypothetical protein
MNSGYKIINKGSNQFYLLKCNKNHYFLIAINKFYKYNGCPVCSGMEKNLSKKMIKILINNSNNKQTKSKSEYDKEFDQIKKLY